MALLALLKPFLAYGPSFGERGGGVGVGSPARRGGEERGGRERHLQYLTADQARRSLMIFVGEGGGGEDGPGLHHD